MIQFKEIQKTYDNGTKALKGIEFRIEDGEFVFLVGPSGSGKSTIVKLITAEEAPTQGRLMVNGYNLNTIRPGQVPFMRRSLGVIFQDFRLIEKKTVEENLALAANIRASKIENDKNLQAKVRKVLGLVGMSGVEKRYPVELSIGECRRVELARAMIGSPPILVLDEITADLDDDNIWDLFHLLHEINKQGTTVIMVTHASQYVNIMRRRVVTLVDGGIFGDVKKGRYGDVVEKATPRLPTRFNIKLQ